MAISSDVEKSMLQALITLESALSAAVHALFVGTGPYKSDQSASGVLTTGNVTVGVGGYNDPTTGNVVVEIYAEDLPLGRNLRYSDTYNPGGTIIDNAVAQPAPYNIVIMTTMITALNAMLASITANHVLPAVYTVAVPPAPPAPTNYVLSEIPNGITLALGATHQITPAPVPSYALQYTTTNSGVVNISATGLITAVGPGTANVNVGPFTDGAAEYRTFGVYVPAQITYTIRPGYVQLSVGENYAVPLLPTISGATTDWTSSNPSVATVDTLGNVHAVATGTATISIRGATMQIAVV